MINETQIHQGQSRSLNDSLFLLLFVSLAPSKILADIYVNMQCKYVLFLKQLSIYPSTHIPICLPILTDLPVSMIAPLYSVLQRAPHHPLEI